MHLCSLLRLKTHFAGRIQEGELGVSTIGVVEHYSVTSARGGPEDF